MRLPKSLVCAPPLELEAFSPAERSIGRWTVSRRLAQSADAGADLRLGDEDATALAARMQ